MSLFQNLIPTLTRSLSPSENGADAGYANPTVKPAYEIKENADAFGVTVYLPGVARENVEITAEDGQFRVTAQRTWKQPEGWISLYRESTDAPYELVLAHDNAIDAEKVVAELRDGVLRVSLPKHEAVKPRKIAVS